MSSQTVKIKFHVLSNQLIHSLALYITLIKNNIGDGKNLK